MAAVVPTTLTLLVDVLSSGLLGRKLKWPPNAGYGVLCGPIPKPMVQSYKHSGQILPTVAHAPAISSQVNNQTFHLYLIS